MNFLNELLPKLRRAFQTTRAGAEARPLVKTEPHSSSYGQSGSLAATEAEVLAVEPEPVALPLIEPLGLAAEPLPVVFALLPEPGLVVEAALLSFACPVTLSLQCVAADMFASDMGGEDVA